MFGAAVNYLLLNRSLIMARKNSKRRKWTRIDIRELKTLARQKMPAAKIARRLKRTERATRQKAFSLGVSLDPVSESNRCANLDLKALGADVGSTAGQSQPQTHSVRGLGLGTSGRCPKGSDADETARESAGCSRVCNGGACCHSGRVLPRPQCQQPHAHSHAGDDRGSRFIARAVSLAPSRAHPIGRSGAGASRARGYRAGDERM